MDQVKFKEIRDKLNSDLETKHYMIYSSKTGWGWGDIVSSDVPNSWEDLSKIEYNEVAPDWLGSGSLLGFIYLDNNCPAVLGYGKRSEEEKRTLMYIWKVNHSDTRSENLNNG